MSSLPETGSDSLPTGPQAGDLQPMLSPRAAWRILRQQTGADMCVGTIYRWLASGRLFSIRLGYRIYIPRPALEEVIRKCLAGERI